MERPDIVGVLDNYVQKQIKVWTAKSNRASQIGDPCIRKLVYYRLYPELQELYDVSLQYIFNEGNLQEQALVKDLQAAGFIIVETQRDFFDQRYNLSGHIDGKILIDSKYYPLEIKSMNPHIWDSVNTIEDFDKYNWTKKYPAQLQSYMFLGNHETAVMLLKNKSTGRVKQLWFDLDYEYCEKLLKKCETINQFVAKKELPERMLSEDCQSFCPFYSSCCPDSAGFTPLDFIDEPEMIKNIQAWELMKDYASEYNRLDKQIKGRLRGIQKAVIGDYLITGKEIKNGWKVNIEHIGDNGKL